MTTGILQRGEARVAAWLARVSVPLLRISMGAIFLSFGLLKFFPGVSPAEDLVVNTFDRLTDGIVPAGMALAAVAVLEVTIGVILLVGRWLRLGVALLAVQLAGILAPLVVLSDRLFAGPLLAPTLEGQYVLKSVVLLAAAAVLAANVLRGAPRERNDDPVTKADRSMQMPRGADERRPDAVEPGRITMWT